MAFPLYDLPPLNVYVGDQMSLSEPKPQFDDRIASSRRIVFARFLILGLSAMLLLATGSGMLVPPVRSVLPAEIQLTEPIIESSLDAELRSARSDRDAIEKEISLLQLIRLSMLVTIAPSTSFGIVAPRERERTPQETARILATLKEAETKEAEARARLEKADERIHAVELRLGSENSELRALVRVLNDVAGRLDANDRVMALKIEELRVTSEQNALSLRSTIDTLSKVAATIGVFSALALGWRDKIRWPRWRLRWPWRARPAEAAEPSPTESSKD